MTDQEIKDYLDSTDEADENDKWGYIFDQIEEMDEQHTDQEIKDYLDSTDEADENDKWDYIFDQIEEMDEQHDEDGFDITTTLYL